MTPIDRLKELQNEIDTLKEQATQEAMTKVQEALDTLNALGHDYIITQRKKMGRPKKTTDVVS